MRRFRDIIEDIKAPDIHNLWLNNGVLKYWGNNGWSLIGGGSSSINWNNIEGKPQTFTPSAHTHVVSDISDFPSFKTINNQSIIGSGNINISGEAITYTFADGDNGNFTVTPSSGIPQLVSIGKPATAGTADSVAWSGVSGKPSFATVATSGSYNDLTNKPSIPSAYTLPTASASVLGGVKVGSGLNVAPDGALSVNFPEDSNNVTSSLLNDNNTHYLLLTEGNTTNYTGHIKGAAQLSVVYSDYGTQLINRIYPQSEYTQMSNDAQAVTSTGWTLSVAETDIGGLSGGGSINEGYVVLYSGTTGNEPIYVAQSNVVEGTRQWGNKITLMDANGNQQFNKVTSQGSPVVIGNTETKIWTGSQSEYTTIQTKDANTLYFITA